MAPPHVIRVVVGGEDPAEAHPVGVASVNDALRVIGRIHDQGLAAGTVADQVDEVAHLQRQVVTRSEIHARQELAEIEAPVHADEPTRARYPPAVRPAAMPRGPAP